MKCSFSADAVVIADGTEVWQVSNEGAVQKLDVPNGDEVGFLDPHKLIVARSNGSWVILKKG
ncbi:MAG: hypothetical protein JSS66_08575 [Armatimonadetes bacterium]|nr:hypothetical protein [Armatimonadota bacterium]